MNGQNGDVCGIAIPRGDLPHCYSVFGAAEIVKVSDPEWYDSDQSSQSVCLTS